MKSRLTNIGDVLEHVRVSRHADEELELAVRGPAPQEDDEDRQHHSTHRVDPPLELRTTDTRQDTKAVDEEIVPVVLPQNADLAVLVTDRPAVQEQAELGREGDGDGDYGRQIEVVRLCATVLGNGADGFNDDDDRDGDHKCAEGEVAGSLDARFA